MALSGDSRPNFTTIADFISQLGAEGSRLFAEILAVCEERKLIGGERLALDGCKLPSNAAKEWSGTFSDLENKERKFEHRARMLMREHRRTDGCERRKAIRKAARTLDGRSERIGKFLAAATPKVGTRGKEKQSNITDNESAKIKTARGMIQGYNGIALVDAKTQIIVQAEAFGSGQEQDLLRPVLEGARMNPGRVGRGSMLEEAAVLADAGYFKEETLKYLEDNRIDAYIPDQGFRKRDPRFKTKGRHRQRLTDRADPRSRRKAGWFTLDDFRYDAMTDTYTCPNGKTLRRWGQPKWARDKYLTQRYAARKGDCAACPLRKRCARNEKTRSRNLMVRWKRAARRFRSG